MKPLTAKLSQDASANQPSVQKEYWDSGLGAAGCIFVARDTGRILLAHRNGEEDPQMGYVEEPDTWATWGGKIDHGESPKEAVVREVEEETGYDGDYKLAFLWTFEDEDAGFQYHNFLAIVQNEFLPKRSWENDRGKWVEWGEWPHPMHFGLKSLLQHAGDKIHRVVTLIKRKHAEPLQESLLKRKRVRKKIPRVITEMIESQDPHQAVLFKKGLAGDGIWEYELKSSKSYVRYRYEPDTKTFYLDNIGTPNQQDQDKGYAKALLETFFQLIKGQGGALDQGTYTTSGNSYIKHVVERLSKQYGVRLVKGRDQIHESLAEWNSKYWIHYSDVDYVKVNPTPSQGKHDPRGIYLFPLKLNLTKHTVGTYWGQKKYKHIVLINPRAKILDLISLSVRDCARILVELGHKDKVKMLVDRKWVPSFAGMPKDETHLANVEYRKNMTLGKVFWMILRAVVFKNDGANFTAGLKKLGYDGIFGDENTICYDEIQLIIFDENNINVIKTIPNTLGAKRRELRHKLSEAYGDPGDHVVFGGVFWPDRVVANVVKSHNSYFGHTHEHGPTRWSYYQGIKTVFWKNYPPAVPEWEVVVKNWLEERGYKVDKQTDKENYYKIMQWYHDRGLLKERQLLMEAITDEQAKAANKSPCFKRRFEPQVSLQKQTIKVAKSEKVL